MCPYEPRDFEAPSSADILPYYRDSGKDSVNINIPEDLYDVSDVSLQRLTVLMESNDSASMIQRVEQQYGSVQNLCNNLGSSITDGLKDRSDLLATRIATYGRNIIPVKKSKSFLRLLLHALKEPTLVILEVAAVVSLAMSIWNLCRPIAGEIDPGSSYEWIESVAILTAVVVIVLVTAVNDYSKEVQFRTLQNRVKEENKTTVIRDGVVKPLPAHELVVGDICLLEYGVIVPADGLLFQGHELLIDESSVTGESEPAKKIPSSDILLLSGTHVVQGSGKMLVTAVGLNSHIGSVYKLLGVVKGHKTIAENGQKNNTVTNQSEEFPPPSPPDFCLDGLPNYRNGGESSPAGAMGGVRKTKEKEESVFQAKLQTLAIRIGIIGLIFASATSTVIIIRFCVEQYVVGKKSWKTEDATTILDSIIVGITILVSAIPEGLPLAVTLTLAFSTKKMMQDNNLVRHLFACETMGCATTICSDKTGTLTTNRMTVTKVWFGEQLVDVSGQGTQTLNAEFLDLLCTAMAVNSAYSSEIVPDKLHPSALPVQRGNRTECALLQFITLAGKDYGKIRDMYPQDDFVKLFPFNSSRKSMLTVVRIPTGWRVFCKGAAEIVLKNCLEYVSGQTNEKTLLTSELGDYITDTVISQMASNALRTICVAYKDISFPMDENSGDNAIQHAELFDDDEFLATDLVCLGIFGIEDPVRPEVPGAIKKCQRAGITVRMVTGDNVLTARSIAAKCGIIKPGDDSLVLEEKEFNRLIRDKSGEVDQKMFDSIIPRLRVLARSTPKGKYTLVEGIINSRTSNHREVVAVTGDGTNDAPALKRADVGFAMGISGTDVAKEASDIILMDDNFVSLVKACMWGRNIYDNVAKFLQFQLTVNIAALSVAIISACVLGDTPLKAVPMLWINMIQDTLGSLALATEPPTEELLKRKPYGRNKRIISRTLAKNIIGQGVYQSVILLALLFAGPKWFDLEESYDAVGHVNGEPSVLYTLIFNALVMMTTFNLLNARCIHGETNMFRGIFNNLYFVAIFGLMFLIQIIVVEFGGYAFATKPLPLEMWAISFLVGIGSLLWYYVIRLIPTKIRRPNKH